MLQNHRNYMGDNSTAAQQSVSNKNLY